MSNLAANINRALGTATKPRAPNAPLNSSLYPAALANQVKNTLAGATNTVSSTLTSAAKTVNSSLANVGKAVNSGLTNAGKAVNSGFTNAGKAMNLAAPPPLANAAKAMNDTLTNVGKGATNAITTTANVLKNTVENTGAAMLPESVGTDWAFPVGVFLACTLVFIIIFVFFQTEIRNGADNLIQSIRSILGLDAAPPKFEATLAPPPPTTEPPAAQAPPLTATQTIVEKILPLGSPEVFNVSKNDFTYYDAEPLCKALGAQLATYDQVKEAYERGGDWCNYGWVKGQVAVYPTQKGTWDRIQQGPTEERGACGKPGLNGGYFDNPELRFGVNCYGVKPNQSAHDEAELMKKGTIPKTTAGLKIDRKVQEFQQDSDELGILPFNEGKWSNA
jgi:hypothetical protein